jgi:2,3-bisphosphoglycerate-independent phosphoglycerate mutase
MGNSEVGHMNIGAGRVVEQDLGRIDGAVADGSLAGNSVLGEVIGKLKQSGGVCHLMGLLSPGGVHSHQDHMTALARIVGGQGVPVAVHAFLDGRDTPPESALGFMQEFLDGLDGAVPIATVCGRYYAMDRDNRWDRVEKAHRAMAGGRGAPAPDPLAAIRVAYDSGVTDEFVEPAVIGDYSGMKDGDGLLMANFRADRARQMLTALTDSGFTAFDRGPPPRFTALAGMAEYSSELNRSFSALFSSRILDGILPQVVADAGMTQLRIAETEKYAHVTYFLSGGREEAFAGEERILIPSPDVATYDLKPEMSAAELTDRLVEAITSERFDLIVVNLANGDMVGHTGILQAAVRAVETVDACLGRIEAAVTDRGGALLITSDHGNCERMSGDHGQPHTAHTTGPVPVVLIGAGERRLKDGRLSDVAPTVLELMGLPLPAQMTGHSLMTDDGARTAR